MSYQRSREYCMDQKRRAESVSTSDHIIEEVVLLKMWKLGIHKLEKDLQQLHKELITGGGGRPARRPDEFKAFVNNLDSVERDQCLHAAVAGRGACGVSSLRQHLHSRLIEDRVQVWIIVEEDCRYLPQRRQSVQDARLWDKMQLEEQITCLHLAEDFSSTGAALKPPHNLFSLDGGFLLDCLK